jgi:hypothetical protein
MGLVGLLMGIALAADGPQIAELVGAVHLSDTPKVVRHRLEKMGATAIDIRRFDEPGAFAVGALDTPGLLALLNRAGVKHPLFAGLPETGPTFVTANLEGARVAYAFIDGRLWTVALKIPYKAIEPLPDPFARDRLRPLVETLSAVCPSLKPSERDSYGNAIAWRGSGCSGGIASVWYEPDEPASALKVLLHPR